MILHCIEVLHMVVRLAVLVCWFDALFRSVVDNYHVTMSCSVLTRAGRHVGRARL